MSIGDWIVLLLVALMVVFAVWLMRRNAKSGKGCTGCCAGCSQACKRKSEVNTST